jgi:ribosomal protein S18 acetylase RimI-like enzyme
VYIEDIRVDPDFRRHGIGKLLIDTAIHWAKKMFTHGIMLETQNTNVQACLFYRKCGFVLGGFDYLIYKGVEREEDEIAVFWYYLV